MGEYCGEVGEYLGEAVERRAQSAWVLGLGDGSTTLLGERDSLSRRGDRGGVEERR